MIAACTANCDSCTDAATCNECSSEYFLFSDAICKGTVCVTLDYLNKQPLLKSGHRVSRISKFTACFSIVT